MKKIICPSIYNIDISSEVNRDFFSNFFENDPFKIIHFDVMDDCFSKSSFNGLYYLSKLSRSMIVSGAIADIHLAVINPEKFLRRIMKMNLQIPMYISFHFESSYDIRRIKDIVGDSNIKIGVSFKLKTEIPRCLKYFTEIDFFNIICNDEKLGIPSFQVEALKKVSKLRKMVKNDKMISVDCGINSENIKKCVKSGADRLVVGSAIFKSGEPVKEINLLYNIINN